MTAKPAVDEIRLSRVLLLLALSVFINYLDRGNLSIAAPLLKNQFQLSATQLGVLLSSFFWTYSFFLPVSGWLVDRLDVKWVIASGCFLWSAATAVTGAVHALGTLLLARLALGAGESVSYPACSTILSWYFPEHKRGFANASIVAGMALGPAFGTLAGGILMSRFGWRPFFLVVGLASLLWLPPWLRWMPKGHTDSVSHLGLSAPGMLQILKQRSAWGTCVGLFCMNYLLYFLLTWLPFYLVRERHFSLAAMAKIAWLAYFLMAVSATSAGWVSDRCIDSVKNSNPGSQNVYCRRTGGGWDLACGLRRQRARALGSMSAVGGGVLGNQRFQYLGNYSNACGTASSWQVDRAAKLLR